MLRAAVEADDLARLKEKRDGLYRVLRALRAAEGPRRRIRAVVLELDELDAQLESAAAPEPEEEPPPLRVAPPPLAAAEDAPAEPAGRRGALRPRTLGFAAAAVFPIAAVAIAYGVTSHASAAGGPVHVRLVRSTVAGKRCSATRASATMRWTWAIDGTHEGEVATIRGSGPGVAGVYRTGVVAGRIRLVRRTPCVPTGTRWAAQIVEVGSTPAVLVHPTR